MKLITELAVLWLFIGLVAATPLVVSSSGKLGAKQCTWGPSYWCGNLTNAKQCGAVSHCIQTVWEHKTVPEDKDSVCQICVKMVKEARDQLESNQTQDDLRAVFEGSCQLIHIKPIVKECIKVVDDFIPELIEALASQMNPQVVCSVAGLCNNAKIDKMLATSKPKTKPDVLSCDDCSAVVNEMDDKFESLSKNEVLLNMLGVCRQMGSFTDACANIILKYFDNIYDHLEENFNSESVCHVAGACFGKYHVHKEDKDDEIEITPLSAVGFVDVEDDVPCDLCKQLVHHLRDILVANTTESEFKYVMEGLCNQTKSFKSECLSIVDQYYDMIYEYLVHNIDAGDLCFLAGICPKVSVSSDKQTPIWPLVQSETAEHTMSTLTVLPRKHLLGANEPKYTAAEIHSMQLPVNRLFVPQFAQIDSTNPQLCTFCEYFLHFVQETISSPKNADSIKEAVEHICEKLPGGVQAQCRAFVDTYGDAFIAIFVQEIDPSQVCPKLSLCPGENVEVFKELPEDKPTCPMCLMAMFELEQKIKNDKTKASIQHALDNLCNHLSDNLKPACVALVDTYYNEIIEMLLADFKPQEVCVYLRLCKDKTPDYTGIEAVLPVMHKDNHDIFTNEIPDDTVNGLPVSISMGASPIRVNSVSTVGDKPQCVMCEFVMKQIEDELENKKNEDEIIRIVNNVCSVMPKHLKPQCTDFVSKYGDMIIQLLIQSLQPDEICSLLGLCNTQILESKLEVIECAVCQAAVDGLEKLLDNPRIDHEIENVLSKVCYTLPAKRYTKCKEIIDVYGESFLHLIANLADKRDVCAKVGLCSAVDGYVSIFMEESDKISKRSPERLLGGNHCTWGPSYWCASEAKANECGAIRHCQENVWGSSGAPAV